MASDTRATHTTRKRPHLTIADLCQAIEARAVPFVRDGDTYEISVLDIRRLRRASGGPPLRMPDMPQLALDCACGAN
jgi:hypothetical protein